MKKKKVGIVGHGFVGKAVDEVFSINCDKFIVDPIYETTISMLKDFDPDCIFICVGTPMNDDGTQNSKILDSCLDELKEIKINCRVIIKSTVLPAKLAEISNSFDMLVYNPEFLREKTAKDDFINSSMILLGGKKDNSEWVAKLYRENSLCVNHNFLFTDIQSASLIKYGLNSFLALKVIFFNQLKDIFEASNTTQSWEDFVNIMQNDPRIGNSHMMVPGHDGKKGFGGACFPKDTTALVNYSESLGLDFSLLREAIKINNTIRSEYDSLDDRELAQNISYD